MSQEKLSSSKRLRAEKRVEDLKGFYQHLITFILVNTALLLFSKHFTFTILSKEVLGNPEFLEWINWNIWGTPIIWSFALSIHAITVFVKSPFRGWEERQIKKLMQEDRERGHKFDNR